MTGFSTITLGALVSAAIVLENAGASNLSFAVWGNQADVGRKSHPLGRRPLVTRHDEGQVILFAGGHLANPSGARAVSVGRQHPFLNGIVGIGDQDVGFEIRFFQPAGLTRIGLPRIGG